MTITPPTAPESDETPSIELAAARRPRPTWLVPLITGGAGVLLGVLLGAGGYGAADMIGEQQEAAAAEEADAQLAAEERASASIFREAINDCSADRMYAIIGDGGRSLTIEHEGEDDFGGLNSEDMWCVVVALKAPSAVISHMEQTTSMDGRQTETWDNIEVSWSYHPDRGMDSVWQITD